MSLNKSAKEYVALAREQSKLEEMVYVGTEPLDIDINAASYGTYLKVLEERSVKMLDDVPDVPGDQQEQKSF